MREITGIFHKKHIVFALFFIIAFVIYSNSLSSSFHFDDTPNITENPDILIRDLSLSSLKKASFTKVSGLRPVSYLSFALNYYFSGFDTTSYHVVNVLIHILNAFLIYLIILRLLGYYSKGAERETRDRVSASAFFTALLWLVTPVNSMAVIFIVQRMTLLCTLFFLLAFLAYIIAREKKTPIYYILTGFFFLLSLMSKQNGVVFPVVILLYELVFTLGGDIKKVTKKEKLILISASAAMAVLFIVYMGSIKRSIELGYALRDFTMYERILTQFRVLVRYLTIMALPLPGRLCVTHSVVRSTSFFSPVTTIFSFAFLVSMLFFSVKNMKKSPYISFAILWFFITISIESTFLPLEQMFEHRMYLPCIFLFGATVDYASKRYYKKYMLKLISAMVAVTAILCTFTVVRGGVWKNEFTLWSDVLKKYPNDYRGYYNYGYAHFSFGHYDKALNYYNAGLKLAPKRAEILFGIGNIYDLYGAYDYAEKYYRDALNNGKPGDLIHLKALNNLGAVYIDTKKFKEVVELFSGYKDIYDEHGIFHYNLAQALNGLGRHKDAVKEYVLAIERGYVNEIAYAESVEGYINQGDVKGAEAFYKKNADMLSRFCIGEYIKGLIAQEKDGKESAKPYFDSYISCEKSRGGLIDDQNEYIKKALDH